MTWDGDGGGDGGSGGGGGGIGDDSGGDIYSVKFNLGLSF